MAKNPRAEKQEGAPELVKFREKRKWQIALRRYVLERNRSIAYAPYFGLDIENLRSWFAYQFPNGIGWDDFGKKWQFDHIIPVTYFDFSDETDLKLCWNFINLRVELIELNKNRGNRVDVLAARNYFRELYEHTQYPHCKKMLEKIDRIEQSEIISIKSQQNFISQNRQYLGLIENYSSFEFEMLNLGKSIEEIQKETNLIKNLGK
jgi:hypothetical protein